MTDLPARRIRFNTIRGHLAVLLILVLLPSLFALVSLHARVFVLAREEAAAANERGAQRLAEAFARLVQEVSWDQRLLAETLVLMEHPEEVSRLLRLEVDGHASVREVAFLGPQGRVLATSLPAGVGAPNGRALPSSGDTAGLGPILAWPQGGPLGIPLRQVVTRPGGGHAGTLVAVLDPGALPRELGFESVDGRMWLVDPTHRALRLGTGSVEDGPSPGSGRAEVDGLDWTAVVQLDARPAWAQLRRDAYRSSLVWLVLAGATVGVGLWTGRRVSRPLRRLRRQAVSLGEGRPVPPFLPDGPQELRDLSVAFQDMAAQVRRHQDALEAAAADAEGVRDLLSLLLDSTDQGLYGTDPDGTCLFINRAGAEALGWRPEELVGRPIHPLIHHHRPDGTPYPDDQCPLERAGHAGQGTRVDSEVLWRRDGTAFPVEYASHPMTKGALVTGVVVSFQDITARKRAEAEREEIIAQLDATISAIADGVVVYDAAGRIVRMNPAAQEIFGYRLEDWSLTPEARQAHVDTSTPEGERLPTDALPLARAFRGEVVRGVPLRLERAGHAPVWISVSTSPVRSPEGEVIGAVTVATDVTRMRRLQEQRDDFLRMVSHDLRAPLAAIQMQAQMLNRLPEPPGHEGRLRRRVKSIVTASRRMAALIRDLVDAERLDSGQLRVKPQPVPLAGFCAELLDRLGPSLEAERIRTELDPDLPPAWADPSALERILVNLLSNALKYAPSPTPVVLSASQAGDEVRLAVRDEGPGIPPEAQARLFGRFHRVEHREDVEGLGLGLYITKGLVEAHGGRIWVESRLGEGTTFHVTLPTPQPRPLARLPG